MGGNIPKLPGGNPRLIRLSDRVFSHKRHETAAKIESIPSQIKGWP